MEASLAPPIIVPKDLNHVAFVPDGNRRAGTRRGQSVAEAYRELYCIALPRICRQILAYDTIHTCSMHWFTPKNLTRDPSEVVAALEAMTASLPTYSVWAKGSNTRIFRIGNPTYSGTDAKIRTVFDHLITGLAQIEADTNDCSKHHLILGVNYSLQDDQARAIHKMTTPHLAQPGDLQWHMDMGAQPYSQPGLFIRTAMPTTGGRPGDFIESYESCVYFAERSGIEFSETDLAQAFAAVANPLVRYRSAKKTLYSA